MGPVGRKRLFRSISSRRPGHHHGSTDEAGRAREGPVLRRKDWRSPLDPSISRRIRRPPLRQRAPVSSYHLSRARLCPGCSGQSFLPQCRGRKSDCGTRVDGPIRHNPCLWLSRRPPWAYQSSLPPWILSSSAGWAQVWPARYRGWDMSALAMRPPFQNRAHRDSAGGQV